MKHALKTGESLRSAVAGWLLKNDISLICCEGNELGEQFLSSFELPELEEELLDTVVNEKEEITLIFQSRIQLSAKKSINGKAKSFVILRYVRALYDDSGNIYKHVTLGYDF